MRKRIVGVFALLAMVLVLTFPVVAPAAPAPQPAAKAMPTEPHPEIRNAIASLRRAKDHLQHASHDFGGHRVDAIRAIDAAIQQLQTCIRYDK